MAMLNNQRVYHLQKHLETMEKAMGNLPGPPFAAWREGCDRRPQLWSPQWLSVRGPHRKWAVEPWENQWKQGNIISTKTYKQKTHRN